MLALNYNSPSLQSPVLSHRPAVSVNLPLDHCPRLQNPDSAEENNTLIFGRPPKGQSSATRARSQEGLSPVLLSPLPGLVLSLSPKFSVAPASLFPLFQNLPFNQMSRNTMQGEQRHTQPNKYSNKITGI